MAASPYTGSADEIRPRSRTLPSHQRGQFHLDRRFNQLAGSIPDDTGQRVRGKSGWIRQRGDGIDRHVTYPFLYRELTALRQRHDMPPLRASPTFARFSKSAVQTLARSRPAAVIGRTPAVTIQICEASRDGEAEGRCASGTKKKKNDRTAGR